MESSTLADWQVDLSACTATHVQGWVFRFHVAKNDGQNYQLDFECTNWPQGMSKVLSPEFDRALEQATSSYIDALKRRH